MTKIPVIMTLDDARKHGNNHPHVCNAIVKWKNVSIGGITPHGPCRLSATIFEQGRWWCHLHAPSKRRPKKLTIKEKLHFMFDHGVRVFEHSGWWAYIEKEIITGPWNSGDEALNILIYHWTEQQKKRQ